MDEFDVMEVNEKQRDHIEELEAAVLREKRRVDSLHQRIDGLEAENADLREAIKVEQDLRKNWHNEQIVALRKALQRIYYLPLSNPGGDSFDWYEDSQEIAGHALSVNDYVNDQPQE